MKCRLNSSSSSPLAAAVAATGTAAAAAGAGTAAAAAGAGAAGAGAAAAAEPAVAIGLGRLRLGLGLDRGLWENSHMTAHPTQDPDGDGQIVYLFLPLYKVCFGERNSFENFKTEHNWFRTGYDRFLCCQKKEFLL